MRDGESVADFLEPHRRLVSMESAVNPSLPRPADSAMEKQAACAAAMSSSGFVPGPVFEARLETIGRVLEHAGLGGDACQCLP